MCGCVVGVRVAIRVQHPLKRLVDSAQGRLVGIVEDLGRDPLAVRGHADLIAARCPADDQPQDLGAVAVVVRRGGCAARRGRTSCCCHRANGGPGPGGWHRHRCRGSPPPRPGRCCPKPRADLHTGMHQDSTSRAPWVAYRCLAPGWWRPARCGRHTAGPPAQSAGTQVCPPPHCSGTRAVSACPSPRGPSGNS